MVKHSFNASTGPVVFLLREGVARWYDLSLLGPIFALEFGSYLLRTYISEASC